MRPNHEVWKTSGYSLKYVLELVASVSHTKVPSKAPVPHFNYWAHMNMRTYIFSRIITANRIKPLVASLPMASSYKSTSGSKVTLIPQAHHNFEINLM